jgi:hypothetical protein
MADRDSTQGDGSERNRSEAPPPDLDPAGGISRDDLDTRRSGARPIEQNDRSQDRELDSSEPADERDASNP